MFENHAKPGVWQYPDFDFPTEVFLEIARELRGTGVKILFDCANPIAYGDDPVALLNQVVKEVRCVHASDPEREGELKPVVIGTGLVPYAAIFSVLRKNQLDGWISIEEASGRGRDGVVARFRRSGGAATGSEQWSGRSDDESGSLRTGPGEKRGALGRGFTGGHSDSKVC